jgi:16S rRNA (adenine1518-N6/adenine1519-N6)-dimethyltransferase
MVQARPLPHAHEAKKRFGQHFLHDPWVIERIVRCIDPRPGDAVVEIGPGLGALTRPLLQLLGKLEVVEIDRDVVAPLRDACGDAAGLNLHLADALQFDFGALAAERGVLRLVGNLPYNISTPLLFHLLRYTGQIRDMHFMLQTEVVDRITASPGSDDYGRLTATLAARAEALALLDVGPGAFRPPPKVHSAVVRLTPRPPPFPVKNLDAYDRVVTAAFGQRRKTLTNALRQLLPAQEIAAAGVDPGARAETLTPAQFAALADRWIERNEGRVSAGGA